MVQQQGNTSLCQDSLLGRASSCKYVPDYADAVAGTVILLTPICLYAYVGVTLHQLALGKQALATVAVQREDYDK